MSREINILINHKAALTFLEEEVKVRSYYSNVNHSFQTLIPSPNLTTHTVLSSVVTFFCHSEGLL